MSFCRLTKGITPKICRLCVCVITNKRSFESFTCLDLAPTDLLVGTKGCPNRVVQQILRGQVDELTEFSARRGPDSERGIPLPLPFPLPRSAGHRPHSDVTLVHLLPAGGGVGDVIGPGLWDEDVHIREVSPLSE